MYAHVALQKHNLLPGQLLALSAHERAFVYASIDTQLEKERKIAKELRRKNKR